TRMFAASDEASDADSSQWLVPSFPPGSFYLEILSAPAADSIPILMHGTTNACYELLTSTDLSTGSWRSEGSVMGATNADCTLVTITSNQLTNLFVWARRCDGACSGILPIDWQWHFFGQTGVSPDGDFDGDGVNNLDEYLNGTDPNKIRFEA